MKRLRLIWFLLFWLNSSSAAILINRSSYEYSPTLLDLFTLHKTRWLDGTKVTVVIFPTTTIQHELFLIEWLSMTVTTYDEMLAQGICGHENNIKYVTSEEEMLDVVSSIPGAIGYIVSERKLPKHSKLIILNN